MSKPDDDTDVPSGLKDDARMERTSHTASPHNSRIYDELGLAPTVSTTSAVYVWHDGTQARLLQARELARLQGLPDSFVLPEGRVVATVSALQAEAWPRWHGRPFYGKVSMAWWQGVVSGGESARDSARGRTRARVQPDHGGPGGSRARAGVSKI